MISSINSLQNMEYMLYGGTLGANPNCPSFVNGYKAADSWNYMNPYQGFNYANPYQGLSFGNSIYNTQQAANTQPTIGNQVGFGSAADMETLADYYVKSSAPSESLGGAAIGGAAFALINNTRFIAHPYNSLSTIGNVEKMFAEVRKDGTALNKLWNNPETHKIMTDAYHKMHKLEGGANSRLGLFKSRIDENTYKALKSEMEAALKSGDKKAIATVTEKIRVATAAKTGWLPTKFNKLINKPATTVANKLADTNAISTAVNKKLTTTAPQTIAESVKHSFKNQGVKGGLFFGALEFLMDAGKIKSAFNQDSATGCKQLGQTTVKAAGSIVGWTVGEGVGAWAGAKLGAWAGTAICPGVGTAIGAVAGLVGGSIGCALLGKITHALVGDDVGTKAEAKKLTKTPEGQVQLLQLTAQQAQEDKHLDPKVKQALNNVVSQYA